MSLTQRYSSARGALRLGAYAGLAGGIAEIAWISVYAAASGSSAAEVARAVAGAATGGLFTTAALGVVIHLLLGIALGIALALAWRRLPLRAGAEFVLLPVILAAVWKFNFFVLLPVLDPSFVHLLPYGVTLTSKLMFGLAAAATLSVGHRAASRRTAR